MTFIDHIRLEVFIDDPPDRFDVIVLQCDVRIIHVSHIGHSFTHFAPESGEHENRFTAFLIKFPDTVFFNVLFSVHTQVFFYLDLNRKTVRVPSRLTIDFEALHCLIAVDRVFQGSRHHVMDARFSVCSRRSFIKYKLRLSFAGFHAFGQQIFFIPLFYLFLLNLGNRSFR